jgi:prepilin-type N-terminal cleavage/methylation domain-containing protein
MKHLKTKRRGLSLMELMGTVVILAIVAAFIIPRVSTYCTNGNRYACWSNKAEIELQVRLWYRNKAGYPAANLSDIGADITYFPQGLPTCPVDGTAYTIDTTTGKVSGHTH